MSPQGRFGTLVKGFVILSGPCSSTIAFRIIRSTNKGSATTRHSRLV
jgi:hypothetical protein